MSDSTLVSAETFPVGGRVTSRPIALAAGLLAVASVLGLIEAALPGLPVVPWLKLGLANIAVVVALAIADGRTAAFVSIGRVVIVGLAAGTIGSPAFVMGAAGAVLSLAVMWSLAQAGSAFSPVGWSAAGAAAHVIAQFAAAGWVLGSWSVLALAPLSILIALPLGALTGSLARMTVSRLQVS